MFPGLQTNRAVTKKRFRMIFFFFGSVLHINFILLFRLRVYDGNKSVFPVS